MPKNVHIWLPGSTHDAGFEEGKHKRDSGGKFATSGAAGGSAEHHRASATKHMEHEDMERGDKDPKKKTRTLAAYHHSNAAHHLEQATRYSPGTHQHQEQRSIAQSQANAAAHHESQLTSKK